MFFLYFLLSDMAAIKFHIIFVGQAVAQKQATILFMTFGLPNGMVAVQNVYIGNMVIGIVLVVVKSLAAIKFLIFFAGLAVIHF